MSHVCTHCGQPVNKPPSEIRRSQKRRGRLFCDRECVLLWRAAFPVSERFNAKVGPETPDGCRLWTGAIGSDGYGRFLFNGKVKHAHRVAMILSGAEVPADMDVDHCVCRVRHCVALAHLRLATQAESALENNDSPHAQNARATSCKQGHEYTPENTRIVTIPSRTTRYGKKTGPTTTRQCLTCYRARRPGTKR